MTSLKLLFALWSQSEKYQIFGLDFSLVFHIDFRKKKISFKFVCSTGFSRSSKKLDFFEFFVEFLI
jgi:hypothetical protein